MNMISNMTATTTFNWQPNASFQKMGHSLGKLALAEQEAKDCTFCSHLYKHHLAAKFTTKHGWEILTIFLWQQFLNQHIMIKVEKIITNII